MFLTASPFCPFRNWTGWDGGEIKCLFPFFYPDYTFQSSRAASSVPQVTLLSFSVDSEFTFVDYIKGG